MAGSFIVPRKIFHGSGSIENLKEIRGKKAVIVTGKGAMQESGYLDKTIELLKSSGIESAVFGGVEPDPSIETVMKGVEFFNREQPDTIVGLGGCSAIDAAKTMWVFYEITPDVAIVDGDICKTMPANVTADTGMDALAHDCEAFVATLADNYTDALVLESVSMVFKNLPKVVKEKNDSVARQAMHDASCMAGMAFTNGILGIIHSMAHQVGGMFCVPHGRANAILMPNIIRYNSKNTGKYERLARIFNKSTIIRNIHLLIFRIYKNGSQQKRIITKVSSCQVKTNHWE